MRRNVLPKFIEICIKTPDGLQHGGQKPTETSVTACVLLQECKLISRGTLSVTTSNNRSNNYVPWSRPPWWLNFQLLRAKASAAPHLWVWCRPLGPLTIEQFLFRPLRLRGILGFVLECRGGLVLRPKKNPIQVSKEISWQRQFFSRSSLLSGGILRTLTFRMFLIVKWHLHCNNYISRISPNFAVFLVSNQSGCHDILGLHCLSIKKEWFENHSVYKVKKLWC